VTGIGFGTWAWGNQLLWGYKPERDDPDLEATLSAAVQGGLSLVDTADSYGTGRLNGRSELLLGQFFRAMEPAQFQQLKVATKLAPFPWRLGRGGLKRAFAASKKRLGGHLDRIQLHWSTARYAPWQELPLLDGLGDLVEQGLVPELGLSNVGPKRLRILHGHLLTRGIRLQSVQVQLSLLAPQPVLNGQLAQVCQELDVELLAYSPLALGILAIPPGVKGTTSTLLRSRLFQRLLPASEDLRSVMAEIAAQRSASLAQVALNWCRAHGACPIPGLRRPVQAHDAAKALLWSMSENERQSLDQLSQQTFARMPANPFQSA
jgi:pyridoxine 4-dehydrogenase